MEGPLSKWTNVMKGWQYRWFVLDDNAGLLSYYTSKEKMMRGSRRGCVRLRDAIIGIDDEDDSTFTITVDQKVFHFQARDDDERKEWTGALEDTILRHSQRQVLLSNTTSFYITVKYMGLGKKLDLYCIQNGLNLILHSVAQTAVTSNSPQNNPPQIIFSNNRTAGGDGRRDGDYDTSIGTSVDGEVVVRPETHDVVATTSSENDDMTECDTDLVPTAPSKFLNPIFYSPEAPHLPLPTETSLPPATSYSSSEDEGDEFYDADEDIRSSKYSDNVKVLMSLFSKLGDRLRSVNNSRAPHSRSKSSLEANQNIEPSSATLQAIDVNSVDCVPSVEEEILKVDSDVVPHENGDMFMQEENSNDNKDVEEHKSVIMHLLSQVKLGMDLTKVVLPTFILERRSLLEMYADFFAHPDLFVEVGEKETAEERMVACLRFYLSTFSAGRNSSVAKKPYNPIIGETFQCIYHVPPGLQGPEQPTVADGPIPWAKSNQLTFYSEQVSHHPPVSAFYTELKDKRMQFNGHIWTKSKFLGLSIGVHNIGQGCLRLLDRDEEYIINFPNGYGRSILTVPWVELGGDCTITCEKTGYNAFIKFHTKPFYGGKAHRISAEIFAPNEKKPLCTVEGDWNDHMFIKYTSGVSWNAEDITRIQLVFKFVTIIRKLVRKIELQGELESRRLWEKVTFNLHNNNIDEATDGKRFLEDRQRAEAKHRLENGIVYKPK
uniref:Oxysterol-binding protein n=1 Tax=Ciona savignyi TaxID=51511 RepID=H2YQU0_CIOSA